MVACLGVVPFGVDHPQVPRLGEALARAGFAALMYWSPSMRDFRLDPADVEPIAQTYDLLLKEPFVDGRRSGLMGTCVGGSFALLAAAQPSIRDKVAFVATFAPYASLESLAVDAVTCTRVNGSGREPWAVDPLTRKVLVHSLTAGLDIEEAELLRADTPAREARSFEGRAIATLLRATGPAEARDAIAALPEDLRAGLAALSPLNHLDAIRARTIAISHDRDDNVIPVGESRALQAALAGRPGVHYTEFALFQHADPTKRKLTPLQLAHQLGRFFLWLQGVFKQAL
jgi:dienelactone hydrolase